MWRAITYGNKASPWMICSADAQRWGNRVWGVGMWTLEYKPICGPFALLVAGEA